MVLFLLLQYRGAFQILNMSSVKRLVYAIIHFLREQSQMDTFTSDEQESLEGLYWLRSVMSDGSIGIKWTRN